MFCCVREVLAPGQSACWAAGGPGVAFPFFGLGLGRAEGAMGGHTQCTSMLRVYWTGGDQARRRGEHKRTRPGLLLLSFWDLGRGQEGVVDELSKLSRPHH